MKYTAEHKGFILYIEEFQDEENDICFEGRCKELKYIDRQLLYSGFFRIIGKFENYVDNHLANMSKKEGKKVEDKDVELINLFHSEVEQVRDELSNIEGYPYKHEVQIVKLNRIFEKYKDALRITDYNTFVKYYNSNSLRASENIIRAKEQQKEEKPMKVIFTYGETVEISLTQNDDGFYVYTPRNNLTTSIKFFSVKDAILFFSAFLPMRAYDENEDSLDFKVTLEYPKKNTSISFYMTDEDKTKIGWTDYSNENKAFNDFWKTNKKTDDSIDDAIRYFIKWVETITESSCINLVQKILKNTPESANDLFHLLSDYKFNSSETRFEKVEEGIGEKE